MAKAIRFKTAPNEPLYACPYYPIGSIYMAVNNINPGTIFGGTWEQIKDKFLLCAGSTYTAGTTGGSVNHTGNCTLTIEQIPSHNHRLRIAGNTGSDTFSSSGVHYFSSGLSWASSSRTHSIPNLGTQDGANQVGKTGGGTAHNHGNTGSSSNMPPYLAVYVWKRVS